MDNLCIFIRLYKIHAYLDLLWFFRDAKYCLLQIFADIVSATATISGILILSEKLSGLAGMTPLEILLMLSYGVIVEGVFIMMFINGNIGHLSRVLGRGQFDHNLLQPVPIIIQLFTEGVAPFSGCGQFLCGIGLLSYTMTRGIEVSLTLFFFCVFLSLLIWVSYTWAFSSLAFYVPANAEEVADTVISLFSLLKSYPLSGFSMMAQLLLCTVIPVGMLGWLPSMLLLKKELWGGVAFSAFFIFTIILLFSAHFLFRRGLRYYARIGSPRYSGFGRR